MKGDHGEIPRVGIAGVAGAAAAFERLDDRPALEVAPAEYWRLLGYPRDHEPSERAQELAAWARRWYAQHGRPWWYAREVALEITDSGLRLDGVEFRSRQLHEHLRAAGARRAMAVAVSAGRSCEEQARQLWLESKPDEYFFLEMFGSAVVEHLVATLNSRICEFAERDQLVAIPHYSPGYTGWDIADQVPLFELIAARLGPPLPEPFEVLSSGMLRPKKALLAVVGLAAREGESRRRPHRTPCESCGFLPCAYRRQPYQHAAESRADEPGAVIAPARTGVVLQTQAASYTVSRRALTKWAEERVALETRQDGSVSAQFRFEGTTCANLGQPLAFDYRVELGPPDTGYVIRKADCRPALGDEGHRAMCAYLANAEALRSAMAEQPLLGRPLDAVLVWTTPSTPSGCLCTATNRTHKWRLALETIHYTLAQRHDGVARASLSLPPP